MANKKTIYKIIFLQLGEIYEIFAKQIYQSDMYGFIEVEEYIFNKNKQLVVDPSNEKLKNEIKLMIAPKLINLVMLLLSIELFIISKIFDN